MITNQNVLFLKISTNYRNQSHGNNNICVPWACLNRNYIAYGFIWVYCIEKFYCLRRHHEVWPTYRNVSQVRISISNRIEDQLIRIADPDTNFDDWNISSLVIHP